MKLVILRSQQTDRVKKPEDVYLQEFNTHYADRVIGNLMGQPSFCTACAAECVACRKPYRRNFSRDIVRIVSFPSVLPYVVENPKDHVPRDVPQHDFLLIIHIHEQILLETLKECHRWGTKGVVVPLEAPDWITHSARAQAQAICESNGIEISFPKPFCAFKPPEGSALDTFRRYFHIGFPEVDLKVENGRIAKANVTVSAACGATYFVARWLEGRSLQDDLEIEVVSKYWHSYPCTASMQRDPELNDDTPLHIAGQAHKTILASLTNNTTTEKVGRKTVSHEPEMVRSPLGIMVQKLAPATENLEKINVAKEWILSELQKRPTVTFDQLRKEKVLTPASFISALLLLKKEGKIKSDGRYSLKDP